MSSKELVRAAVHMQHPERVPLLFALSLERSDVVNVEVVRHFLGPARDRSEWGFEWVRMDGNLAMGQPRAALIERWSDLPSIVVPDPYDPTRFDRIDQVRADLGDGKYYKANFSLSGFAVMSLLRGFSATLVDLHQERTRVEELAEIVFDFEEQVIRQAAAHGFDAIGLADDWGTQQGLFVSPAMWREVFKPRYRRQIDVAHRCGLDVYLHCCGAIAEIVPDLVEIGLDILNLGQPDINGVADLGRRFGGRICFACPVSYQTVGITGSRDQVFAQVKEYVDHLGRLGGGLIGVVPEDSKGLGLTQQRLDEMVEAFRHYGTYGGMGSGRCWILARGPGRRRRTGRPSGPAAGVADGPVLLLERRWRGPPGLLTAGCPGRCICLAVPAAPIARACRSRQPDAPKEPHARVRPDYPTGCPDLRPGHGAADRPVAA